MKGGQRGPKECYLNFIKKIAIQPKAIYVMMDKVMGEATIGDAKMENAQEECAVDDNIDLWAIESESQAFLMDKLRRLPRA